MNARLTCALISPHSCRGSLGRQTTAIGVPDQTPATFARHSERATEPHEGKPSSTEHDPCKPNREWASVKLNRQRLVAKRFCMPRCLKHRQHRCNTEGNRCGAFGSGETLGAHSDNPELQDRVFLCACQPAYRVRSRAPSIERARRPPNARPARERRPARASQHAPGAPCGVVKTHPRRSETPCSRKADACRWASTPTAARRPDQRTTRTERNPPIGRRFLPE